MTAASIGINQINDGIQSRSCTLSGAGMASAGVVFSSFIPVSGFRFSSVPRQAGIKTDGSKHGQYHHCGESNDTWPSVYRGKTFDLYETCQQRYDKNVEHRPTTSHFNNAIKFCSLQEPPATTPLHHDQ